MTSPSGNVVEIDGVTKSFRTGVTAVQDIVLDIRAGEFVSLIGPSGCGKSTLLRIIGDLIQPTSGAIVVNGKSAHQARLDHDYGIVFQDSVLYDWRTVSRTSRCRWRCSAGTARAAAPGSPRCSSSSSCPVSSRARPWQLSGGMQQRVVDRARSRRSIQRCC